MSPEFKIEKSHPVHLHLPVLWGEHETNTLAKEDFYGFYITSKEALEWVSDPKHVGGQSVESVFFDKDNPHGARAYALAALGKEAYQKIRYRFRFGQAEVIDKIVESMNFDEGVLYLDLFKIMRCTTDYLPIEPINWDELFEEN